MLLLRGVGACCQVQTPLHTCRVGCCLQKSSQLIDVCRVRCVAREQHVAQPVGDAPPLQLRCEEQWCHLAHAGQTVVLVRVDVLMQNSTRSVCGKTLSQLPCWFHGLWYPGRLSGPGHVPPGDACHKVWLHESFPAAACDSTTTWAQVWSYSLNMCCHILGCHLCSSMHVQGVGVAAEQKHLLAQPW